MVLAANQEGSDVVPDGVGRRGDGSGNEGGAGDGRGSQGSTEDLGHAQATTAARGRTRAVRRPPASVNSSNQIYRYTGHDANPWIGIPGGATDIGVAADGNVWHVNSSGGIWRYTGDQPS